MFELVEARIADNVARVAVYRAEHAHMTALFQILGAELSARLAEVEQGHEVCFEDVAGCTLKKLEDGKFSFYARTPYGSPSVRIVVGIDGSPQVDMGHSRREPNITELGWALRTLEALASAGGEA